MPGGPGEQAPLDPELEQLLLVEAWWGLGPVPFFEEHPLVIKNRDFRIFAGIVRGMIRKEHLDPRGFERLVRLAYSMNEHGKQRARRLDEIIVGSSETARQAPLEVVPER